MKNRLSVRNCIVLILIVTLLSGISGCSKKESTITLFAAASLTDAMTEITNNYQEKNSNITIILQTDSSGTLQTQIEEGAECDVFFSAGTKQIDALTEEGFIGENDSVKLLENKVVLIKPAGTKTAVTGFADITKAANIALAGEDVPVGDYARQIFGTLGILDDVMSMEINECANVSAVLAAVSEGSNEVGVVYATDAKLVEDSVDIIEVAPNEYLTKRVVYPVGLVKNDAADDNQTEAAKDFYEYLQSDDALSVLQGYGFSIYE